MYTEKLEHKMAHLTQEEVDNIYYQGTWVTEAMDGFDYQAFAVAVQNAAERKNK